jgi:hypothetical protein
MKKVVVVSLTREFICNIFWSSSFQSERTSWLSNTRKEAKFYLNSFSRAFALSGVLQVNTSLINGFGMSCFYFFSTSISIWEVYIGLSCPIRILTVVECPLSAGYSFWALAPGAAGAADSTLFSLISCLISAAMLWKLYLFFQISCLHAV